MSVSSATSATSVAASTAATSAATSEAATSAASSATVKAPSCLNKAYHSWMDWTSANTVDLNTRLGLNTSVENPTWMDTAKKTGKAVLAVFSALVALVPTALVAVFNSVKNVLCSATKDAANQPTADPAASSAVSAVSEVAASAISAASSAVSA